MHPRRGCRTWRTSSSAIRRRPYAMLLLSGGDLDCAGYSLMGWDPFLVLRAKGDRVSWQRDGAIQVCRGNPFTVLNDLLAALELPGDGAAAAL